MHAPNKHPVERLLHWLAECICRRRAWFVYPQVALFAVCLLYAGSSLKFSTDRNDLVSADESYQRHWLAMKEEFQVQEDMVTLVESEELEKNRQFVERLAVRLEAETNLFKNVFYKRDLRSMGPKALLFLPEAQLEQMLRALRDYEPLVRQFSEVTNLNSLFAAAHARLLAAARAEPGSPSLTKAVPALTRIVEQGIESLQRPGVPPSPGMATLFSSGGEPVPGEYLHFAGGRYYLITCAALDDAVQEAAIVRLRELVQETQREVPGVNVGVTGEPVLRNDEMRQAQTDTTLASVVALVVVALTFIFCYQEIARPLKATACLIVGIGYTLGFATLTVGHLNILTITFVPILIGLAIDFGVHLIARFEEELREGRSERVSLDKALVASGTGIFTSGVTMAASFLAMTLTGFKGIQEMGLISGGGLLVCLVPMMTMLPAMLLRHGPARQRVARPVRRAWHGRRERIEQVWLQRPRLMAGAGAVLTVLAGALTYRVAFDYNLLNLQSQDLPAVIYERKMVESAPRSILPCTITANSLEEALALENRIRRLRTVAAVDSVAPILTGNQDRKLELVKHISEAAAAIQFAPRDHAPVALAELDQTLQSFGQAVVGAIQLMGTPEVGALRGQLHSLRESIGHWRDAMAAGPVEQRVAKLTLYQQALFADLESTLTALKQQEFRESLRAQDLPPSLRSRFIGSTGKLLLQIHSKENVWEHQHQEAFVRELRTIDPAVTGSPVRFYEFTNRLKSNFQKAAAYALAAIALMLLAHFRNVACVLLALLPVFVGILWTLGLMAVCDLPFNPANIIAPTLLIGIGVSNGIHILNRFTEEKHPSILGKSTGKAVLVSALTTITGFGSLMLAKHAGIASLGLVMALGSALCMLAALTVLPALLLLLTRSGWKLAHGWLSH